MGKGYLKGGIMNYTKYRLLRREAFMSDLWIEFIALAYMEEVDIVELWLSAKEQGLLKGE